MGRPIKKLIILKCSHCSKEFPKYPSQVKKNINTVFCGNQCVIDYRKIHWKSKIDLICIECGKEFKIYQSELKKCKGAGSFCSKKCQSNGTVTVNCLTCKIEFKAYKSNLKRFKKTFCSKKCYNSRTNIIDKFFNSISKETNSKDCWIWKSKIDKDGYGIIYIKSNVRAHRFSYEFHNKISIGELLACHKCDNPICVNPDHIFIGTALDNAQDRDNKGRGYLKNKYK